MAFPPPPGPAAAPPPPTPPKSKPLAQVSAMGAATAPPGSTPMGTASDAPAPAPQAQAPSPQAAPPPAPPAPPIGVAARPVVAPHASTKSVGTHGSRSPNKRLNAPHGMVQGAGPAPARPVPPQFQKK